MDEDQRDRDPEIASVYNQLIIENKVKLGIQNMLQAHDTFKKGDVSNKQKMEQELITSNNKLAALTKELEIRQKLHTSKKNRPQSLSFGSQPDLSEFKNKDIEENINYIIETLQTYVSPSDLHLKLIFLKKVSYWLDYSNPRLESKLEFKLFNCFKTLLLTQKKELILIILKLITSLLVNGSNLKLNFNFNFFELKLDLILIKLLTSSTQWEPEREQSLKLIQILIPSSKLNGNQFKSIVSLLISIADNPEDKFRLFSLQLLCEFLVNNPKLVVQSAGSAMKVILNSLFDLPLDLSKSILQVLLVLLDKPNTRQFINPGYDFETIISVFFEFDTNCEAFQNRLEIASELTKVLLRSWNGIMYLCLDKRKGFKYLISAFNTNSETILKTLLNLYYSLFDLTLPDWDLDINSNTDYESNSNTQYFNSNQKQSLIEEYNSILIKLLFESGLFEELINLLKSKNQKLKFFTILLIGELLILSNRLKLKNNVIIIQSLPKLLELSLNFKEKLIRHEASRALVKIDKLNAFIISNYYFNDSNGANNGGSSLGIGLSNNGGNQDESVGGGSEFGTLTITPHRQNYIAGIKRQVGGQIDDNHFKAMLNETQVLMDKDFYKWNFDIILELLQGPLLNSKRLEETQKNTKFIKRLLQFYAPNNKLFCEVKNLKYNHKYVQVGCELMYTLLANQEGVKILMENELLAQLRDHLNELDPIQGSTNSEPLFSSEKMKYTLTSAYFILLGALSKYKTGLRILEKFRIFDSFYHLSEGKSRDDLTKAIITSMDYRIEGHPHVILSKILTSAYKHMRLFATNYLRVLLRSNVKGFNEWGIRLLITQLYDPSIEVCEMAVLVLDEACINEANLATLVEMKPNISHLDFATDTLLLRYLSTSEGLNYLLDLDYIDKQMELWFKNRNEHYVTRIELSLSRALSNTEQDPETSLWLDEKYTKMLDDPEKMPKLDGLIFPHFYGQLTKTSKGCDILIAKGHLNYFSNFVQTNRDEFKNEGIIKTLKSNLWTLGHIGASETGLGLLCSVDIIRSIVWIWKKSKVFSLKGTAYFVIGLISSTKVGNSLLIDIKQEFTQSNSSDDKFCQFDLIDTQKWEFEGYSFKLPQMLQTIQFKDPIEQEIKESLGNLTNQVLIGQAIKNLIRLKAAYPAKFKNPKLFIYTSELMNYFKVKFQVRQLIQEFLEVEINEELMAMWKAMTPGESGQSIGHKNHLSVQITSGDKCGLRLTGNRQRKGTF